MSQTKSIDLELSSSQYLTIADNASLSITGDITFEVMFKLEQLPSVAGSTFTIHNKGNWTSGSSRSWYCFINTSNVIQFILSADGTTSNILTITQTDNALTAGEWIHVAITVDVSTDTGVIYINGRQVGSTSVQTGTFGSIYDSGDSFYIGARNNSGSPQNFFDGKMKNFRLWNDIRTQKEVIQFMGTTAVGETGLVSEWRFEDDATDSESSNDLTENNSPVYASDVPNTMWMVGQSNWSLIEKKTIDISGLSLSGDLSLYPLPISNLETSSFSSLESDGKDLRFTTDEDGLYEVPFELVDIDTGGGTIEAWVLLPTLDYNDSVDALFVWGGYSSAVAYAETDILGAGSVWSVARKAIFHLGEASGNAIDSTLNSHDGTDTNTVGADTGKIGGARSFVAANTELFSIANHSDLRPATNFSIQGWIKTSTKGTFVVQSYNSPDGVNDYGWQVFVEGSNGKLQFRLFTGPTTPTSVLSTTGVDDGAWHHFAAVYDTTNSVMRVYIDGAQENTTARTGNVGYHGTNYVEIGRRHGSLPFTDSYFNGLIEEVRFTNEVLGADWIKANYNLQNDPASYITNTAFGGSDSNMFLLF